ncbi:hypothetical protein B0H17DRAFT_1132954 [Mycena rosella]|uniref:Uncharacterized protein n=1 Tax=Mycena rosella TaxID=1033263 RepID=A0AAD7GFU7_MYCRO|nr:hypothetical protein B0H17DRAFT_1132954 [Mycena rosella]
MRSEKRAYGRITTIWLDHIVDSFEMCLDASRGSTRLKQHGEAKWGVIWTPSSAHLSHQERCERNPCNEGGQGDKGSSNQLEEELTYILWMAGEAWSPHGDSDCGKWKELVIDLSLVDHQYSRNGNPPVPEYLESTVENVMY